MCGICGLYAIDRIIESETLIKEMVTSMRHRGPDFSNDWCSQKNNCHLGHTRLSILDLSESGNQPMHSSDSKLHITYNGEIYNYKLLRDELIDLSYSFKSNSDTEVLLYAYKEFGIKCLEKLEGMFAFGIYDEEKEELFIARDRFGKKPLYYNISNGRFIFASEIKAILRVEGVVKDINYDGLKLYLNYLVPPAPLTLFKDIYKLPSSSYAIINKKGFQGIKKYYNVKTLFDVEKCYDEKAAIKILDELLEKSVGKRMQSDVPFGVFLSGGVDSSTNVAIMSKLMNKPVETFTVSIKNDEGSDESKYAREVSELYKTNHHEVIINDSDFLDLFENLAYYQDEPLADPVCVPLYYVSKLARKSGVYVIQLGEGSDEIFAGYGHYQNNIRNEKMYRAYSKLLPEFIKKSASKTLKNKAFNSVLKRAEEGNNYLYNGSSQCFLDYEVNELFGIEDYKGGSDYFKNNSLNDSISKKGIINNYVYHELNYRIPELLLMRVDKMLMANSIEGRAPFLDKDLVEFAISLNLKLKIKNGNGKYILKKAMEKYLPKEILYRKKIGFCGSSANMMNKEIERYTRDLLLDKKVLDGLIPTEIIEKLFVSHKYGKAGTSLRLWALLNLALWKRTWFN